MIPIDAFCLGMAYCHFFTQLVSQNHHMACMTCLLEGLVINICLRSLDVTEKYHVDAHLNLTNSNILSENCRFVYLIAYCIHDRN
jgi:hypothetical protein